MISVPIIQNTLHLPTRDGGCNGPWGFGVVGLSWTMFVKLAIINDAPWVAIMFGGDYHPGTPLYGVIDQIKALFTFQPCLHVCHPVVWDSPREEMATGVAAGSTNSLRGGASVMRGNV